MRLPKLGDIVRLVESGQVGIVRTLDEDTTCVEVDVIGLRGWESITLSDWREFTFRDDLIRAEYLVGGERTRQLFTLQPDTQVGFQISTLGGRLVRVTALSQEVDERGSFLRITAE